MIYNSARTGYLVKRAQAVAREEGLELVTRQITSPKEVVAALESLQDGIDALWIVPDETILSQAVIQQMLLFSYRRKIPVLGLSDRHAQMGAVFALSFASGEDIGRQAGELAETILGRASGRGRPLHHGPEGVPDRQPQSGAEARAGDPAGHPGARHDRDPVTGEAGRRRFRGFSSFRARIFWSVVPIVVSFLVFQGWMNVREHRRLVTEEFEKRGRALASNLGFASELGALSEDKQLLETTMRGALRNPDVAYVVIHGGDGRILANGGRPVTVEAQLGEMAPGRPLSRSVERAGQRFIEFVSPIVSEQAQTADEALIETRAAPPGEGPRVNLIGGVRLGLSLAGVEEQVRGLLKLWGGVTFAFLLVGTFVIYGFSRRITNPVKQLTEQAQKIAAGHLEEQIPVKSRDEIGQLATAFNSMTGALQVTMSDKEGALAELQELNRTLEDRIRQRTAELQERSAALERSLEEVRAMGDVSRAIGASLDLAEVLNTIATHALRLSSADACGIFELDAARERLVVVAALGLSDDLLKMLEQAPMPDGGRVARRPDRRGALERTARPDPRHRRGRRAREPRPVPAGRLPGAPRRAHGQRERVPRHGDVPAGAGSRGRADRGALDDAGQPVPGGHRQCPALQGARGQERAARGGEPSQVRLPRQREP